MHWRGSRVNFMKLTLLPRRCIYRIADRVPTKGKLEAAGFLPLLALFCLTKLGFACEAFGFVQPCCSGTLWLSDAVCLRVHCATVPWEWLHKVLCTSRDSIPRPSNLLSEHDPLCRRGSRVNFMKLTLLRRRCIYRIADRVPTKGWKVAGSKRLVFVRALQQFSWLFSRSAVTE